MKIALAQIRPEKGNIGQNIAAHLSWIELAAAYGVDAVFFPELSITGYEPELAQALACEWDDPRFDVFQSLSEQKRIAIGAGMPIRTGLGICIAMLIFQPQAARTHYAKQLLHSDELPYFVSGKGQVYLELKGHTLAPAICYESLQENHIHTAAAAGSSLYLASVAKSQKGIDKAQAYFPEKARTYQMHILMCNAVGYCDNFMSAGQSAVWNAEGVRLAQLDSDQEGLLIYDWEQKQVHILYVQPG